MGIARFVSRLLWWRKSPVHAQTADSATTDLVSLPDIEDPSGRAIGDPDPSDIARAIERFLSAPSWHEKHTAIEEDYSVLSSYAAMGFIIEDLERASTSNSKDSNDSSRASSLVELMALLQVIGEKGIAAGWDEYMAMAHPDELPPETVNRVLAARSIAEEGGPPSLTIWLGLSTDRDRRRYLERHLELLNADAELAELKGYVAFGQRMGQSAAANRIQQYVSLLDDVRARGGTVEAVRDAFVNLFGGFVLDVPDWLEETNQQLDKLVGDRQRAATAHIRAALLGDALIRAKQSHDEIAREVLATLEHDLADALQQDLAPGRSERIETAIKLRLEVLTTFSRNAFPVRWAQAQINLSGAYIDRIHGDRRDNLESAIACLEAALEVFTREGFAEDWARIQSNLGIAYSERINGNRRDNLELAIACFEAALEVFTHEEFPADWARTQSNLGPTFAVRIKGIHGENIERGIACLEAALAFYSIDTFPVQWAMNRYNLGTMFFERTQGRFADNIEQAIACLNDSLDVYAHDTFPDRWANAQNALGTAYSRRVYGSRRENVERAIAYYESALLIRTHSTFPFDWAQTMLNLGATYFDRIDGDSDENRERAIAYFMEALKIYTFDDFPREWAKTQMNLGGAYAERGKGDRSENIERSIEFFENALQVYTYEDFPLDWAGIQGNLAIAYSERELGDKDVNLERAIACHASAFLVYTYEDFPLDWARNQGNLATVYVRQHSLRTGGDPETLNQAIACFHAALRVYTPEDFPERYREVALNLAITEASEGRWEAAHQAFVGALQVESLLLALEGSAHGYDAIRQRSREASTLDAFVLVRLGRLEEAIVTLEHGRARGLSDARALDFADPELIQDPDRRQRYQQRRATLIAAKASLNRPMSALELKGEQRAVHLAQLDAFREAKLEFDAIVAEIRQAEDPRDFLEDDFDATAFAQLRTYMPSKHALVYLLYSRWGGIAIGRFSGTADEDDLHYVAAMEYPTLTTDFVVSVIERPLDDQATVGSNEMARRIIGGFGHAQGRSGGGLIMRYWPGATFADKVRSLAEACRTFNKESTLCAAALELLETRRGYAAATKPIDSLTDREINLLQATLSRIFLRFELNRCLPLLGNLIMRPLAEWLQKHEIGSLTLIPTGALATFPLLSMPVNAAEAPEDWQTLSDLIPVSVSPSARALLHPARSVKRRAGVFALGDSRSRTQPLAWAEAEAHTVAAVARRVGVVPAEARVHDDARKDWLLEVLRRGLVVDVSCHGLFNGDDFLASKILLARGEELSLGELLGQDTDLHDLRLLILSSCQTAMLDLLGARDEVRSLTTGMLQAGAQAIIGALWSVDDLATCLLIVRFVQEWFPRIELEPPAAALARAQRWLRTATNMELGRFLANDVEIPASLGHEDGQHIQGREEDSVEEPAAHQVLVSVRGLGEQGTTSDAIDSSHETQTSKDLDMPYADPLYWSAFQVSGW